MSNRTLGWSLLSSGIVTLVIGLLPFPDIFWGLLLLFAGILRLFLRR